MLKEIMEQLRKGETDVAEVISGITEEMCGQCEAVAVAYDMWSWLTKAADSGIYRYYKHCTDPELMLKISEAMKEYGCEQFSKAYLRGAEKLIPLLKDMDKDAGTVPEEILTFSEKLGSYIEEYEFEIEEMISDYLLDNYDLITAS